MQPSETVQIASGLFGFKEKTRSFLVQTSMFDAKHEQIKDEPNSYREAR